MNSVHTILYKNGDSDSCGGIAGKDWELVATLTAIGTFKFVELLTAKGNDFVAFESCEIDVI
jgi:hypothetical protein